jgi:hypothetical protein
VANAVDYAADDAWIAAEDFGESVTHQPRDDDAEAATISAVVVEEPPQQNTEAGKENVKTLRVTVTEDVPVSIKSTWTIRGEEWQTLRLGTLEGGLRQLWVSRRDAGIRTKGRLAQ